MAVGPAPDALDQLARDGVLTRSDLLGLGVTRSALRHRTRPGGPWQQPLPGVLVLHSGPSTPRQRLQVALLHAGAGAMLTGSSALVLHRVAVTPPSEVELLVPATRQLDPRPGLLVRRCVEPPRPVRAAGLPVAPLARAVVDHGLTHPRDSLAVVCQTVQRGRLRVADLERAVERAPRRGGAALRAAVAEVRAGTWSPAEASTRRLIRRGRLPAARWNRLLIDAADRVIGRPDAWWPDAALAVAVQSRQNHLLLPDWGRTMEGTNRLSEAGLLVVQVQPVDVRDRPEQVLAALRAARQAGLARGPVAGVREAPEALQNLLPWAADG